MSLLRIPSSAPIYRPSLPPESLLREIVAADFNQRFDACVASAATIWGYGFRMCRVPLERREWMDAYFDHLQMALSARAQIRNPR